MEEDLTIDNGQEPIVEKPDRSDNRFKDLSEKVKTTAEERDKAKADAEAAIKEVEFYKGFSNLKYPDAVDYQDKIKEKVMAGYDMEDAAISVLAKAGKLNSQTPQRESPVGGSATTTLRNDGDKPLNEMNRSEKRAALEQIERESGGVSQMLRRGL